MANFCGNCGSPLKEGYKFCENCGASVEKDVVATAAAAGSAMSQGNVINHEPVAGTSGQGNPQPGMPPRWQRPDAPETIRRKGLLPVFPHGRRNRPIALSVQLNLPGAGWGRNMNRMKILNPCSCGMTTA